MYLSFPPGLETIAAADVVAGAAPGRRSFDGAFGPDGSGAGWGVGAALIGALGVAAAIVSIFCPHQYGQVSRRSA